MGGSSEMFLPIKGFAGAVEQTLIMMETHQVNTPLSPPDILDDPSNIDRGVGEPTMRIHVSTRNGL